MGDGDSVTLHRDNVKIGEDRNLYNYHFTVHDTSFEDLMRMVEAGDAGRVSEFLTQHPHVPMTRKDHPFSPLHFAAKSGSPEIVRALVERGAPLDSEDGEHGSTPLGWAAFFGRPAAVAELLKAGARVTANSLENARAGIDGKLGDVADATEDEYRAVLALLEKGVPAP